MRLVVLKPFHLKRVESVSHERGKKERTIIDKYGQAPLVLPHMEPDDDLVLPLPGVRKRREEDEEKEEIMAQETWNIRCTPPLEWW